MPTMKKVQLFTDNHRWCKIAIEVLNQHFPDAVDVIEGKKGQPQPDQIGAQEYDLTISFLSPFIIPKRVLDNSKLAVNFHPGNRHYPGAGCYNFALYQDATQYGVVCHHMEPTVDTGPIIIEENFPVLYDDTVETLQFRSYVALLGVLQKFLGDYLNGANFFAANISWYAKPYTKRQINNMQVIPPGQTEEEIARRARAFAYPGYPLRDAVGKEIPSKGSKHATPLMARLFN